MALVRCGECNRDVSDKATSCPGCGAPIEASDTLAKAPEALSFENGQFIATREMMAELTQKAVIACNYRVDASSQADGTVAFTTGMTMGSFSGVSGVVSYREIAPYRFEASGSAKQNVKGGQVLALDLFGESKAKVENVVEKMKAIAAGKTEGAAPPSGCVMVLVTIGLPLLGLKVF